MWGVYSFGYNTRWDGFQSYFPVFDRRHNINLVSAYTFGKDLNWEINGRWNFGSGFPFTQNQGFYELFNFSDGIGTDYTNANGDLGIEYAELNEGRLPYYHRLDASVSKSIKVNKKVNIDMTASVTNAYNRENIFYFNRVKYERVNQLPIMPSFGASITF